MSEDEYLPLMEAAKYLGVSRMKLSQLAKEGAVAFITSPLDKRVKMFKVSELDELKRAPGVKRRTAEDAA
jgi:excisionase family DNA binding protein